MKATVLGSGTSQGVPIIGCRCEVCSSHDRHDKRLRSSLLVSQRGTTVVIDAGPDFRYQMLREGVDDIDAIIFTHGHKDHTGGLDDVRAFNYVKQKSVDIYANAETMDTIRNDYYYAFAEHPYPAVPE
ncbi:MAG: MBL fold metallo-hydrolase, partial [Rikenellaceae bacterium]|nr:MBL fold metallo-hydrolase [Rikenellaceae bacterium]